VDVVLVDLLVQVLGFGNGAGSVPGEARVNFDGHAAVNTVGGCCHRCEEVAGVGHVGGGDFEDGLLDAGAGCCLRRDDGVVVRAGRDGGVEDGRVGGHTNNVLLFDQLLQRAGLKAAAGKVIEPDGYSGVGELLCRGSHGDIS